MSVAFIWCWVPCRCGLLCDRGGCPVAWQKITEVLFPEFVLRHPAQDILKPCPFIHAMGLAGGQQGIDHGGSLRGLVVPAEQVVLAALCWQYDYVGIAE